MNLAAINDRWGGRLDGDAYFSLNGFVRGQRGKQHIRWLTSCFADLDCYRLGVEPIDLRYRLDQLQLAGELPQVSMYAESGRGLWAFWLLAEGNDQSPVRAWPEKVELWDRIQATLNKRLAKLGADAQAYDASRVSRVPGSINTKAKLPARYWISTDSHGNAATYGLQDIADRLGVKPPRQRRRASTEAVDPARRKQGKLGRLGLGKCRAEQLEMLSEMRGGFPEGCRNSALLIYASALMTAETPRHEVARKVHRLAAHCRPSFPVAKAESVVKSQINREQPLKWRNERIVAELYVTPLEAEAVGLASPEKASRSEIAAAREQLVRQAIERDRSMSIRAVHAWVREHWAGPKPPSRGAIATDLRRLSA
ncbi:MAG: hypothetical protein AAGD32_06675 [Planctomycetota bacterium]